MGKNNKKNKTRYVHEDYDMRDYRSSRNNRAPKKQYGSAEGNIEPVSNNKKPFNNKKDNTPREAAPIIKDIFAALREQAEDFISTEGMLDEMSIDQRRARETGLFSSPNFKFNMEGFEETIYLLERSCRTDKETHKLLRATCTILVMGTNGEPAYHVTGYLTKNMTGSLLATPITATGPDYRANYREEIGTKK